MTTELKKLNASTARPAIKPFDRKDFNFTNGFNFGFGLAAAFFVFSVVVVPMLICAGFVILSMLGISLGNLAAP